MAPDDPKDPQCLKAKNQLKAFSRFQFDPNSLYSGTIIRIPLRTRKQASTSKICSKEVTSLDIKGFLRQFADELGGNRLLFLKHIMKGTLRIDDDILSTT
jgi:hypothetical protein